MSQPGYTFPVLGDWRITSPFGNRESPGGIGSTNHRGIDIGAAAGRGIVAPVAGNVIFAGRAGGYGNQVKIMGQDGLVHSFSHLQGFNVKQGAQVTAGTLLGAMGSTGNATGPHLHYEVRDKKGNALNPQGLLSGALSAGKGLLAEGAASIGLGGATGDAVAGVANILLPGSGFALGALGVGGESCGIICQIQNWIKDSGFFQRLALAILAFIIIAGAMYMMKSAVFSQAIGKVKGALA